MEEWMWNVVWEWDIACVSLTGTCSCVVSQVASTIAIEYFVMRLIPADYRWLSSCHSPKWFKQNYNWRALPLHHNYIALLAFSSSNISSLNSNYSVLHLTNGLVSLHDQWSHLDRWVTTPCYGAGRNWWPNYWEFDSVSSLLAHSSYNGIRYLFSSLIDSNNYWSMIYRNQFTTGMWVSAVCDVDSKNKIEKQCAQSSTPVGK